MKDVGGRGVINDDDLFQVSSQMAQVFDIVSFVKDTGLPEETAPESPPLVQQVRHGVRILQQQKRNMASFKCSYVLCYSSTTT